MKKIFFIVPYPLNFSPSQRFRFEQYFSHLKDNGYEFRVSSFLQQQNWRTFYHQGNLRSKATALFNGAVQRLQDLVVIFRYEFIFIHREAMPVGPPIFEWFIAKVYCKKIIYDFDDAIWLPDQENEKVIKTAAKWRSKIRAICSWAHKISCGNEYLCQYAATFNSRAIYNPTIVDTEMYHNPDLHPGKQEPAVTTIGWTGSHSTLKYLTMVEDVLTRIKKEHSKIQILIIADRKPAFKAFSSFNFVSWNATTEIEDLLKIDIGIMPLPDEPWAKGKCGFKAIQYLALGIPAVVSPVGANTTIVDHGQNGFLADTEETWHSCITQLVQDEELRKAMGQAGRAKVISHYSVRSNLSTFLSLFE